MSFSTIPRTGNEDVDESADERDAARESHSERERTPRLPKTATFLMLRLLRVQHLQRQIYPHRALLAR